jgi:hypothetical protein
METQATTPAPAQVSEPVHPIHAETAILERLTRHTQETPENDPHAGTDLEVPQQTQEPQQAAEPDPEAPPEVEFDEDTPVFDLGLPEKLSFKQLREGYLAKQDYHRNIQKVKAEEKALQEKLNSAAATAAQQYAQNLEIQKQALIKFAAPEIQNVDLNQLAQSDPAEAQRVFFKQLQFNQTLQQIQAEQKAAFEKVQAEQTKQRQEMVQKARETLAEKIPGWTDEKYQKVLKAGVDEYGFAPEEVSSVVDPRVIELLHDASEYRSLKKAKPEIQKKVVAVPKVIKPGSADKPNPATDAVTEAQKRFSKSGDWRDAAHLLMARGKRR